ncbi:MFS transporter [Actinacidiphila oryziradicis]|uniref:MFS transporter n=1 Tax=Actinacidiphila oryziradicis TaxID=2571141 RepID=UPI00145ED0DB|nr:MFS transporter [Actinacidiphila oryziradicis]
MLPALRNRNYRLWLLGLSVANVGTWMQRIAQDWLVLELTGRSGTALGLVTGVQFLPILLFGPVGGMLADRFPRRALLLWTQAAVGLCGLALGTLVLSGGVQTWHVYLIALMLGVANAVFQPTVQAFVLELVTREEVPSVVGLSGGSFHAARLIGPGVAGALIAVSDTGPVFLIAAATAIAPIVALVRMDPARLHEVPADRGGSLSMLVAGVRYAMREPEIRVILGVTAFVGTFSANSPITNALMATHEFGRGAREFGLLGSVTAIGSLVGAALAARRKSVSWRFVTASATAFATVNLLSAFMPGYTAFAIALVPVGLTQLTFITAANSSLQLGSAPEMRGRVMALFMVLTMGTTPVGAPLIGWIAQQAGARTALVVSNLVALLGIVVVLTLHLVAAPSRRAPVAEPVEAK